MIIVQFFQILIYAFKFRTAKKLCANDYQNYIAIAITKGYLDYIKER